MKRALSVEFVDERLNEGLARTGHRFTAQRRQVFGLLLHRGDHPTAEEVFIRVKKEMPDISLATVYNCLDTLVGCGLVRQVIIERGPSRYCANMTEHDHFYCDDCGGAFDVSRTPGLPEPMAQVPPGFRVRRYEVSVRGLCSRCASRRQTPPAS